MEDKTKSFVKGFATGGFLTIFALGFGCVIAGLVKLFMFIVGL
jgi:hypothetical protein